MMLETMLDQIRIALYVTLIVILFFLFQAWERDHTKIEPTTFPSTTLSEVNAGKFIPSTTASSVTQTQQTTMAPVAKSAAQKNQLITVTTDIMQATIDTRGGDIIETKFLKYPESLSSKKPFVLLNDDPATRFLAESGLVSKRGPDTSEAQAIYTPEQTSYTLQPGQNELSVKLNWQKDGINVVKTFTFARNSYEINVGYDIDNQSTQPWEGSLYTQLLRTNSPPKSSGGLMNLTTYFGAAVSSPQKTFLKIPFKDMQEKNFSQTTQDGWAAMIQHYFTSAWIPSKSATSNYYSRVSNGLYTIGMIGQPIAIEPKQKASTNAKLYVGPATTSRLTKAAPNLQLTIDYGLFWAISGIIFWMMQNIYDVIGNWGWSIVIVTIIIKLLFYPFSAKSYRSMSALKNLQPRIEAIKERYGDDRQKVTQATLELYRQEKVNPMSGCLPVLIQIPVFIALYWVLVESVELRQAPFILWIKDLSQADPYYVLPLLMAISMFIQQRLNPPPPDPLQAKIMMAMPIVFGFMFANFPAGLMLYWFVNNTLSFLQQWYVMQNMNKKPQQKIKQKLIEKSEK